MKYNNPITITSTRKLVVQSPVDDRIVFLTLKDLIDSVPTNAVRFYQSLIVFVESTNKEYVWKDVTSIANLDTLTKALSTDYVYPGYFPAEYATKSFNFFELNSTSKFVLDED